MQELIGTGVALVTPFTATGTVDCAALEKVVLHQITNGIDYLVVLGTTGESVTLSKEEKQIVIETIVSTNAGKLPLVLGVGGNNTQVVVEELRTLMRFFLFHHHIISLLKKGYFNILKRFLKLVHYLSYYITCLVEQRQICR